MAGSETALDIRYLTLSLLEVPAAGNPPAFVHSC